MAGRDAIYIDPHASNSIHELCGRPFEQLASDENTRIKKARSIIGEQYEQGLITEAEANEAINTQKGTTWDIAYNQAKSEVESEINNPWDFVNLMSSPLMPIDYAYKIATGNSENIGQLPFTRTIQNLTALAGIGLLRGESGILPRKMLV
jgi:hypothetical protein